MDLMKMLQETKGGFATLESTIEKKGTVKSRITGEPFNNVFEGPITAEKTEYVNIKLNYEVSVNRQQLREGGPGDFEAESLPWGEWVIPNLVITHKGEYYLRYYEDMNRNWESSDRTWYCGKRVMTAEEIIRWKNEFGPIIKDGSGRQEVEKAIRPRTVKFRNITRLVFDGKEYIA